MDNFQVNQILYGHSLDVLKSLPNESIDCIITSPPYWALRDYKTTPVFWDGNQDCDHHFNKKSFCTKCGGWYGELGLEPDFNLYIHHLCSIFDEAQRILKNTGTCWVNTGDTYGGSGIGLSYSGVTKGKNSFLADDLSYLPKTAHSRGRYDKSLLLIPFKFAVEMQKRGWIIRNVIIWQKPNAMPHSVKDRFTVDFEYLFFFVKNKKYYFNQQFEPIKETTRQRARSKINENKGRFYQGMTKEHYENFTKRILYDDTYQGRNKRTVWNIATTPFKGAHFAVYPPKLIETPILAGCPEGGVVLDPFLGSGTTAVVAQKLKRNWVGIELNAEYIKLAKERLKHVS